jgi:hypothetical protein
MLGGVDKNLLTSIKIILWLANNQNFSVFKYYVCMLQAIKSPNNK